MNIVFRADASINIGFGHVMRCLALADKLSEVGASVCFICRESSGNLIDYLRQKEIRVIGIPVGEKEKKYNFCTKTCLYLSIDVNTIDVKHYSHLAKWSL